MFACVFKLCVCLCVYVCECVCVCVCVCVYVHIVQAVSFVFDCLFISWCTQPFCVILFVKTEQNPSYRILSMKHLIEISLLRELFFSFFFSFSFCVFCVVAKSLLCSFAVENVQ